MKHIPALLFVPAKENMLAKLPISNVEVYILDLEDSIEESDKEQALERLLSFLEHYTGKEQLYIRLNQGTIEKEAKSLKQYQDIGFVLPKFENINAFDEELVEIWQQHPVIALIETPKGVVNVENIASCDWVDALALGAEDYTAAMNMENSIETLAYAKGKIVTYAKAYGKKVYDTPTLQLKDDAKLNFEIHNAVRFGFDGKLAIHPKQIPAINSLFFHHDIERMKQVVALYEKEGKAVLTVDNQVYEKMHINRMRRIIEAQD
ncbi:MAG: CoA ester lyase [Lachnospiraceae bacterium]|nr:CoA ester lyase [Lachnospiraceae bacterium]